MTEVIPRPLRRDEALRRLRALEPALRARGVLGLFLFGSTGRDEAVRASDLDLFFDPDETRPLGVLRIIGISHLIGDELGVKADLMTRNSLHPLIRADVEAEALRVF